jgi:hypothetical protein
MVTALYELLAFHGDPDLEEGATIVETDGGAAALTTPAQSSSSQFGSMRGSPWYLRSRGAAWNGRRKSSRDSRSSRQRGWYYRRTVALYGRASDGALTR